MLDLFINLIFTKKLKMKFLGCFLIIFIAVTTHSQIPEKIKLKKDLSQIYFFIKGAVTDSIIKNNNDTFYLIVPDSLKKTTVIAIENGQLLKTSNDSLVRLNYMYGLKYESQYVINELPIQKGSKKFKKEFELISLINGTSSYQKNKIGVQIINKKEEKIIIETSFYVR